MLVTSSLLVLQFEYRSPGANITTGADALWWAIVTITTVGYGDYYPVTELGRLTGVFVMFAGVGIIGALASILASLLVSPAPAELEESPEGAGGEAATADVTVPQVSGGFDAELARTRAELLRTRDQLAQTDTALSKTGAEIAELRTLLVAIAARTGDPIQG